MFRHFLLNASKDIGRVLIAATAVVLKLKPAFDELALHRAVAFGLLRQVLLVLVLGKIKGPRVQDYFCDNVRGYAPFVHLFLKVLKRHHANLLLFG